MTTYSLRPRDGWEVADGYTPPPLTVARILLDTTTARTATDRDLHAVIAWAYDHTTDARVLWGRPTNGLVIAQAAGTPDPARLATLTRQPVETARVRTDWAEGDRITLAGILSPEARVKTPRENGRIRARSRTSLAFGQHPEWLTTRLSGVVDIDEVAVEPLDPVRVRKRTGTVVQARTGFHATATVTHPHRLAYVLANGLGAGRAYGCGLLLAAEAR